MALTFDLGPRKSFRQFPLTWRTFTPSFIEIHPVSTETSHHVKEMLTDQLANTQRRTAGRIVWKHNAFCWRRKHNNNMFNIRNNV